LIEDENITPITAHHDAYTPEKNTWVLKANKPKPSQNNHSLPLYYQFNKTDTAMKEKIKSAINKPLQVEILFYGCTVFTSGVILMLLRF